MVVNLLELVMSVGKLKLMCDHGQWGTGKGGFWRTGWGVNTITWFLMVWGTYHGLWAGLWITSIISSIISHLTGAALHDGGRIISTYCVQGLTLWMKERVSALAFLEPGLQVTITLNLLIYCAHRGCLGFSYLAALQWPMSVSFS